MAEIKEAMPAPQPEALDMPDDEVLYELADLFRVFGDSTRIKSSAAGAQGFQARAVPARGQNRLLRTRR